MNYVLSGIVVTPRNVNLLTKNLVVIAVALCPRFHGAQVRACARLGQIHRSRPDASVDIG